MLASEFINTMVYGMLCGCNERNTFKGFETKYETSHFIIPRIWCADGFNISVQVNRGNYCGSENGTRTFGLNWVEVEWGFPSEPIDGEKYRAEDKDNTTGSVGGYVDVKLLDELCEQHGGIDLPTTLGNVLK